MTIVMVEKTMRGYSHSIAIRLQTYIKQNRNYHFSIGYPLANPMQWLRVIDFNETELLVEKNKRIAIADVVSFIVTYPSGEILDAERVFFPLPKGAFFVRKEEKRIEEILIPDNLAYGNQFVRVTHCRNWHDRRKNYYTTSLINLCNERIKVKKFAAYTQHVHIYLLNTVAGGYFSEQQFIEWFGVAPDGWIEPGQTVTDPNNYAGGNCGNCFWVYFCDTESNKEIIAGEYLSNINPWWKFWQ